MGKIREGFRPLRRSEGLAHIENYYLSGQRPSEYCKEHGITECQFYGWRRRYLELHPQPEKTSAVTQKKFHPLKIESPSGIHLSGLELHYPNGVRVLIGKEHSIGIEKLSALIKLRV